MYKISWNIFTFYFFYGYRTLFMVFCIMMHSALKRKEFAIYKVITKPLTWILGLMRPVTQDEESQLERDESFRMKNSESSSHITSLSLLGWVPWHRVSEFVTHHNGHNPYECIKRHTSTIMTQSPFIMHILETNTGHTKVPSLGVIIKVYFSVICPDFPPSISVSPQLPANP